MRIAEAARIVGVSPSTLRDWERLGLLRPARGSGGQRVYGAGDVGRARDVARLRGERLNLPAIHRFLPRSDGTDRPPKETDPAELGARLRALRSRARLTLREAASRTDLSASFISAVERGLSGASLAALQRLTAAYGTTVGEALHAGGASAGRLVRGDARRAAEIARTGIRIEELSYSPTALEAQLFLLEPGASSDGYYAHAGEELMFVLDGRLGVWLGEAEYYELDAGDALTFPSTLSHRFRAIPPAPARLIWINTPPTF
jgi:DNA-binding transcriptional MerR regulator/quercetin dioxygenase-like cupin family protein